jgi:hypothetical protein
MAKQQNIGRKQDQGSMLYVAIPVPAVYLSVFLVVSSFGSDLFISNNQRLGAMVSFGTFVVHSLLLVMYMRSGKVKH